MSEYNEPWKQENGVITDSLGKRHPDMYEDAIEQKTADRIVACVNACAGISDEDLKRGACSRPEPATNVRHFMIGNAPAVEMTLPRRSAEMTDKECSDWVKMKNDSLSPVIPDAWPPGSEMPTPNTQTVPHDGSPLLPWRAIQVTRPAAEVEAEFGLPPGMLTTQCPDCYEGLNGQVEKCGRCKVT